jgi:hypothetical protein
LPSPETLSVIVKRHPAKNDRTMKPKIFEPNRELAEFVKCYWTLESAKEDIATLWDM